MKFDDCPDVRIAQQSDEEELVRLAQMAAEEDNQGTFDIDKVRSVLNLHFHKAGGIIGVIGNPGHKLKAFTLLAITQPWYSSDGQVQELSLFVDPDHRKTDYAKQLMVFSKKTSEALNLQLSIGVIANEKTEAKVRLYQRQFPQAGAFFRYNPQA
jgi:GNAT superfamily N-acetyltransferase